MAKTELTKKLERALHITIRKMGVFTCSEVGIADNSYHIGVGKGIVDYMSYDTSGIWRCYEIKVSKQDFYSKHKHTFVGNFNYYVMTKKLYELVQQDIPKNIGVYIPVIQSDDTFFNLYCIKKPQRQEITVSKDILNYSFIKSLSREFDKFMYKKSKEHELGSEVI